MEKQDTAILEWQGKDYELKFTFDIARRLRSEGINIMRIWREMTYDPAAGMEYGDDIAYTLAWLLRQAGAKDVTDEQVWRECMADDETLKQGIAVFSWVCLQYRRSSDIAPKKTKAAPGKKKAVRRKKANG